MARNVTTTFDQWSLFPAAKCIINFSNPSLPFLLLSGSGINDGRGGSSSSPTTGTPLRRTPQAPAPIAACRGGRTCLCLRHQHWRGVEEEWCWRWRNKKDAWYVALFNVYLLG